MQHQIRIWLGILFLTGILTLSGQNIKLDDIDLSTIRKDIVVVKIKSSTATLSTGQKSLSLTTSPNLPFTNSMKPMVSHPLKKNSALSGIYKIQIKEGENIIDILRELRTYADVAYAEPIFLEKLLQIPNDPLAHPTTGSQYYLEKIKAYDAWDISTGSSDIIIGISDTGIDFTHEDISPKIYTNPNEILNGIDDDENGFIDDIHGFDFGDDDNDPQCGNSFHGNFVAGVAGASTNNTIGISGVGYNSTISPLKVFPDNAFLAYAAYEGIVYAADNGYDVINLSWGSTSNFSQFNQDIINYAVLEKNLVIIAAGGNSGIEEDFYPASYDHVLSVGWTNEGDSKAPSSTFSYKIDLVAPGENITSALNNNGYHTDSGSSFAAPIVAGAAALVKDVYPNYNAEQIMEVLRVSTDNIYDINDNSTYEGKLGSGRLNVYNALTQDSLRSVRLTNISSLGEYPGYIFFDDSINLNFTLKSYLDPIISGKATFSSPSPYVSLTDDQISFSFSSPLQQKTFSSSNIYIYPNTPPNTKIPVRMDFKEGGYNGFQYLVLTTSPDQVNIDNDNMELTITGNGNLGLASKNSSSGVGLKWKNKSLVKTLGIIIGNAKDSVSDNITQNINSYIRDNDFSVTEYIKLHHSDNADHFTKSTFVDSTSANSLGLKIEQKLYAFADTLLDDFIILEYRLTNLENDTLRDLGVGMYANWELGASDQNKALLDKPSGMSYSFSESESLYTGIKIFGIATPVSQSLDLGQLDGNILDFDLTFTDSLKHRLISESLYDSAGFAGSVGNNIAQLTAMPKFKLNPHDSKKITFILAAGQNFESLKTSIDLAEIEYDRILKNPTVHESFVSCNGASLALDPISGTNFRFYTDPLGLDLIASGDTLLTGEITSDTVFYLQNIDSTYASEIEVLQINLVEKVAKFSMSKDTLYLDHPTVNAVSFTDDSFEPISWRWNFGDGTSANSQNPTVNFREAGSYNISLVVETDQGCLDTEMKTLVVATRPALPQIGNVSICINESVSIMDTEGENIAVYLNENTAIHIFKGLSFELIELQNDTTFYISRFENGFESLRKKVEILVQNPDVSFHFEIDTTTEASAIILINDTYQTQSLEWVVDGNLLGITDSIPLEISKNSYEIQLSINSLIGCQDQTTKTLAFSQSPTPTVSMSQPCFGESLLIHPQNGKVFGFYEDINLSSFIAKGSQLNIESATEQRNIYIVGLDSVLASTPIEVTISPIDFEFDIIADPEILDLSKGKNSFLSTTSTESNSWKWYLDGTFIGSLESLNVLIPDVGTHEIVCEAYNDQGCTYIDTLEYEVVEKMEDPLSMDYRHQIQIYPNPTSGKIYFEGINEDCQINVLDLTGRLILVQQFSVLDKMSLNLTGNKSGVYIIQISKPSLRHVYQIILE